MGLRAIGYPRRCRDRYSRAFAFGTDLTDPGKLEMRDTLQKHLPNLVAVLGTYACFAFALGLVAISLYLVLG
jgi:hypothetical protein